MDIGDTTDVDATEAKDTMEDGTSEMIMMDKVTKDGTSELVDKVAEDGTSEEVF